MTFLEAYDALSSDDPATREECAAMLLTSYRWLMDKGEIVEDAPKEDFFGRPRSERAQQFLSKILDH